MSDHLEMPHRRLVRALGATVWAPAFRRWAVAYFGQRWTDRSIDRDYVDAYKVGFRAGWRARGQELGPER